MQEDPSLTRARKRFRGNIEDTEQNRERHRVETPERTSEQLRKMPPLEAVWEAVYEHRRYPVVARHTLLVSRHIRPTHPKHKRNSLVLQAHNKSLPCTEKGWVMILNCLFFEALAQKTPTSTSFCVKQYGALNKYKMTIQREHSWQLHLGTEP